MLDRHTFHCLLRAQLDKLRPSEGDPTDISKDVVGNDKHHRQEEPDHAFEDIVHDEVCLHNDQV